MKVKFQAYIPPNKSALQFGGDEGQVVLAVSGAGLDLAVNLMQMKEKMLNVTVEEDKPSGSHKDIDEDQE